VRHRVQRSKVDIPGCGNVQSPSPHEPKEVDDRGYNLQGPGLTGRTAAQQQNTGNGCGNDTYGAGQSSLGVRHLASGFFGSGMATIA